MDPAKAYEDKWKEYQATMHKGAWRIGWGFFGATVGFLPLVWLFIWMVGARNWERTLFHAPLLMWLAVPLCLVLAVAFILHLYRLNLALDARKRVYLTELRALKASLPSPHEPAPHPARSGDPDAFRDDDEPLS